MPIRSNPNLKPSEVVSLLAVRNPVSQAAATVTTGWIAAKDFGAFLAVISLGAMTATSTVDAKLEQATTSGGAGAKDITGKAITQLTAAGVDDNKQVMINLRPDELDIANAFTHFRLSITVAAAASLMGAQVWGFDKRYDPVANVATVDEIVA